MTLADLRQEFEARGFDYLSDDSDLRTTRYLNRAYQSICDAYEWPFLETDSTGVAPLALPDLRSVLSVVDQSNQNPLYFMKRIQIIRQDANLAQTGNPTYWFSDAENEISVWPVNTTNTLSVHYIQSPVDMSFSTDVPLIPARFHYLIVDLAVVYAYEDSDNDDLAAKAMERYLSRLEEMRVALLHQNLDTPDIIMSTYTHIDG